MTPPIDGAGSGESREKSHLDGYRSALPDAETKTSSPNPPAESAEPGIRRDDAWRHERVAKAAYYLAAKRGFEPGHEAEDWSLAELQIDAIDAGRNL